MRASTRPVGGASSDNDSAPSRPLSPALGSEDGSASEGEWQQPRSRNRPGGYQSGKVSASFNAAEPDLTDASMGHVFPGTIPEFPTLDASPKTQKSDGVEGAVPAADIKIVPCYFGSYNHRARFRIAARWNCYPKAPPGKARDSEAKEVCRFGRSCRLTLFEDQVLQQPADPEAEFKPVDSSTRVAIEGTQRPASGGVSPFQRPSRSRRPCGLAMTLAPWADGRPQTRSHCGRLFGIRDLPYYLSLMRRKILKKGWLFRHCAVHDSGCQDQIPKGLG